MKTLAIVVTYNGAQWVDRCLGSLHDPSFPVDTLVVDNGSTDGTLTIIEARFPGVEVFRSATNLGFGQACNIGLRKARDGGYDHVFLLNQDAWVLPGTIKHMVAMSGQTPDFGIISPIHLNGAGDALDKYFAECIVPSKCKGLFSDLALGRAEDRPYPVDFVNAAAWLVTRQCIRTIGGFSPSFFHYGEDENYVARMLHHGLRIGVLPTARIHHDRAGRGANPYFADHLQDLQRRTLLTYADPRREQNRRVDRREWRIRLWQARLFGRSREAHAAQERLDILGRPEIEQAIAERAITRIAGPVFL